MYNFLYIHMYICIYEALVDYDLLQTEYQIRIGSGVIESLIKQIDRRLQI